MRAPRSAVEDDARPGAGLRRGLDVDEENELLPCLHRDDFGRAFVFLAGDADGVVARVHGKRGPRLLPVALQLADDLAVELDVPPLELLRLDSVVDHDR